MLKSLLVTVAEKTTWHQFADLKTLFVMTATRRGTLSDVVEMPKEPKQVKYEHKKSGRRPHNSIVYVTLK